MMILTLLSRAIAWTVRQVLMAAELYRLQRENERRDTEIARLRGLVEIVEAGGRAETPITEPSKTEPPKAEPRTPEYEAEIRFAVMDAGTAPKN